MTRRARLRNLAAWTLAWPDLPALALGSALQAWDTAHGDYLAAVVLCAIAGKKVRVQR